MEDSLWYVSICWLILCKPSHHIIQHMHQYCHRPSWQSFKFINAFAVHCYHELYKMQFMMIHYESKLINSWLSDISSLFTLIMTHWSSLACLPLDHSCKWWSFFLDNWGHRTDSHSCLRVLYVNAKSWSIYPKKMNLMHTSVRCKAINMLWNKNATNSIPKYSEGLFNRFMQCHIQTQC